MPFLGLAPWIRVTSWPFLNRIIVGMPRTPIVRAVCAVRKDGVPGATAVNAGEAPAIEKREGGAAEPVATTPVVQGKWWRAVLLVVAGGLAIQVTYTVLAAAGSAVAIRVSPAPGTK